MGELLRLLREGLTWDEALARLAGEGAEAVGSVQEWAQARLERYLPSARADQPVPVDMPPDATRVAGPWDPESRYAAQRAWEAREREIQRNQQMEEIERGLAVPRDPDVPSIAPQPSGGIRDVFPEPLQRAIRSVQNTFRPSPAGAQPGMERAGRVARLAGHDPENPLMMFAGDAPGLAGALPFMVRGAQGAEEGVRFYSRLQRALDQFPDEAASPGNLRTYLSKQGVKDAEIDWVLGDLEDLATEVPIRTGRGRGTRQRVALDDVRRRAEERAIQLKETVLGGGNPDAESVEDLLEASRRAERQAQIHQRDGRMEEAERLFRESEDLMSQAEELDQITLPEDAPKFAKYTEPGGENYREVVLSLDDARVAPEGALRSARQTLEQSEDQVRRILNDAGVRGDEIDEIVEAPGSYLINNPRVRDALVDIGEDEAFREAAENMQRARVSLMDVEEAPGRAFTSEHYPDIDNPVVHIRMSDRVGPDGERVLHVEEIQSDWAAKGRREGFGTGRRTPEEVRNAQQEVLQAEDRTREILNAAGIRGDLAEEIIDDIGSAASGQDMLQSMERLNPGVREALFDTNQNASFVEAADDVVDARFNLDDLDEVAGVPDMPFRDTEDWLGLAVRRVLDEASVGNYDRIAWTPGARQAERYSEALQEAADRVTYNPRTKQLQAFRGDEAVLTETVPRERLPDFVGKDAADSLLEVPAQRGVHEISGTDLRVNDAGMIKLYDELLPGQLRRHARDLGVDVQIGDAPIQTGIPAPDDHIVSTSAFVNGYDWGPVNVPMHPRGHPRLRDTDDFVLVDDAGEYVASASSREELVEAAARPQVERTFPAIQLPPELRARILQEGQRLLTPAALIGGGGLLGARGGLFSPPERR